MILTRGPSMAPVDLDKGAVPLLRVNGYLELYF